MYNSSIQSRHLPTGSDDLAAATDLWSHEDQENSFPSCAHSGSPGLCVFVAVLTLSMIQDKAMVASKHFLIETEDKLKDGLDNMSIFL